MNRNEYRRAFIMLRAAMPGYGGHVRLERRTLTGSMYFIVTAPQGVSELSAALAGQRNGEYYATPIGPLTRDRRGQLALAWQFDPRAIDGRPLEAYAWVVVAATGGPCAVALTGNVEGSRAVDAAALGRAVCALFEPEQAPAADLPGPEALVGTGTEPAPALDDSAFVAEQTHFESVQTEAAQMEAAQSEAVQSEPVEPAAEPAEATSDSPPEGEGMRGDVRIYTLIRSRPRAAERRRTAERPRIETAAPEAVPEPSLDPAPAPEPTPEAVPDEAPSAETPPATAAKQLGLDITTPWPEKAEPLRRLFATQAPVESPLADGYTYVRSPMPAGSGYGDCLAGVRVENGAITGVRCALPGAPSPEPPAGLEGYTWTPVDGGGYWVWESSEQ